MIVHFPQYEQIDAPGFNDRPGHVCIQPQECSFTVQKWQCSRRQIPLRLAWAVSIHKSQGLTIGPNQLITRAILDMGPKEFALGLTFVAISRCKALECLMFSLMPSDTRLRNLNDGAQFENRQKEASRVHNLALDLLVRRAVLWQNVLLTSSP